MRAYSYMRGSPRLPRVYFLRGAAYSLAGRMEKGNLMHKGLFIALEGGEGVGKTTQMNLLKERLPRLFPKREFVFTLEPGGTPLARNIRELILSEEAKDADGAAMFGLFIAARADHVRRVIAPALLAHKVVISDRYVAATFAYQVVAMDGPVPRALFERYLEHIPMPDLSLILDLDPCISQKRVRARAGHAMTHFDTRPAIFHERLREGYRAWAAQSGEHARIIDAAEPPLSVHLHIIDAIRVLFERGC